MPLNLFGASLASYASMLIGFPPFIILEATWSVVALVGPIRAFRAAANPRAGSRPFR